MTTYNQTKQILENHPDTRNSDKLLIWLFWSNEGAVWNENIAFGDFLAATSPESITRARRMIQAKHPELEPTSEKVRKQRGFKEATKGTFVYREDNGQGVFL